MAVFLLAAGLGTPLVATAQSGALIPIRRPQYRTQSVDAQTAWSLQSRSSAVLSSPIVRLGDVVEPLDPNLAAWDRLRRISIGLLPTDGTVMTIQRDRLTQAITSAEATPREVIWYGPNEIHVHFDPSSAAGVTVAHHSSIDAHSGSATGVPPGETGRPSAVAHVEAVEQAPLDKMTADRLRYWIELAIRRDLKEATESFEVELADAVPSLAKLRDANGIESVALTGAVASGEAMMRVTGRHRDGPIVVDVPLRLTAHPLVVVAVSHRQRGERLTESDVKLAPLPKDKWQEGFATQLASVVGQEVRGVVRGGEPISLNQIGAPILVQRGDLVEVRVVGGGILITTNAKSLGEGAAAELIEVETIQPRRRLVAKVIQPGVVEIITRAPQVEPTRIEP